MESGGVNDCWFVDNDDDDFQDLEDLDELVSLHRFFEPDPPQQPKKALFLPFPDVESKELLRYKALNVSPKLAGVNHAYQGASTAFKG